MAISGRSEGCSKGSALPPKADITSGKLHRSLKADIGCPLNPQGEPSDRGFESRWGAVSHGKQVAYWSQFGAGVFGCPFAPIVFLPGYGRHPSSKWTRPLLKNSDPHIEHSGSLALGVGFGSFGSNGSNCVCRRIMSPVGILGQPEHRMAPLTRHNITLARVSCPWRPGTKPLPCLAYRK